jgi:ferredoxin
VIFVTQSEEFIGKHKRYMAVDRRACMWCGACVGICPQNAITLYETRIEFDDECNLCKTCVIACPVGAIDIVKTGDGNEAPAGAEGEVA